MKPVPLRHFIAVVIAVVCTALAISHHYALMAQQYSASAYGFGVPPPPVGDFFQAILVCPGVLSGLPLIIAGAVYESDWLLQCGQIFGAVFFWYSFGWWVDCVRGAVEQETPPRFVMVHLSALRVASTVLFPLALIGGMSVGNHFCANNEPPFLSELLSYGIVTAWVSVGTCFAWQKFRAARRVSIISLTFPGPSA